MDRTGLAPQGQDDEAVRWIAVRHAGDHIHIVGTLARQDGARPQFWNDYYRVREACQAAEERHGLRRTAPGDRTADRRPARAEHEKARREGRPEAPRITLRRAVATAAAGAGSEEEFFTRLREAGVLIRARYSTRNPGQVTGYAVALTGDTAHAGGPVWFGGGKLAADLTLPKLRARWDGASASAQSRAQSRAQFTAEERNAILEHVARTAHDARERIRRCAATDPAGAADAAWAASDTLHAAAAVLSSRVIRQAADGTGSEHRLAAYVVVSLLAGVRTEEARALRWSEVDLEEGTVAVYRSVRAKGDTKTRKSRRLLKLPKRAVESLREHRKRQAAERLQAGTKWQDYDLVFCRQDGAPLDRWQVRREFAVITMAAGLGDQWAPRELRHSFVSILSAHGVRIEDISDLVGHSGTTVTESVYRHEIRPALTTAPRP